MKRIFWLGAAALSMFFLASACSVDMEGVEPQTGADETQRALLGKWRIEHVNNRLCRSGNCNTLVYRGAPEDFFEFRADSAFIFRAGSPSSSYLYRDKFRADYRYPRGFVLSDAGWWARYDVKTLEAGKLVVETTFTGTDPNAVFTDTYFLYR